MKKLLTLTCLLILSSCAKEIPSDQLVERQGFFYEINTTTPFTGRTVSYHQNGQLRSKANYKNGKYNDLREIYFENGEFRAKANYKNGKKDGLWEEHYRYEADPNPFSTNPSSNKSFEFCFGIDAFGQNGFCDRKIKSKKGNYKDGKKDGLWEEYYKNGQLKSRKNYIDDREEGLRESYFENGQLREKR